MFIFIAHIGIVALCIKLSQNVSNTNENIPCIITEPFGEGKEGWKVTRINRPLSQQEFQNLLNLIT
jgi:hypothetical protein